MTAPVRLHNSWTRRVEPFEALEPGVARIYACGPTVYDYAHIGNFRFNVWVDVLRRALEWSGFDVTLVMNITDVDDNTIAGAQRANEPLQDYTRRYARAFFEDLEVLRIRPADVYPHATDHVDEMIALVEQLLAAKLAYRQGGSVFFRVAAFPGYGKLSRLDPESLRSGERVEGDDYGKESARDFALWKEAKEGEPSWKSPWGPGRPGWHLECSAMSMKYLGSTFDLHLGGVDLMFPHHENEIAQSVGATGAEFARYWLHCAHLMVDGAKMSKSLGNQHTLRDLLEAGHDPVAIRYLLASVHYRKQLNLTFEALEQAKAAVARVTDLLDRLERGGQSLPERSDDEPLGEATRAAQAGFAAAIADDLNTSGALGHMFSLVRATNAALDENRVSPAQAGRIVEWLRDIDRIWAILPEGHDLVERRVELRGESLVAVGPRVDEETIELIVARMQARAERDFETADRIRARLEDLGVTIEDTPGGVRWHTSSG